MTIVPLEAAGLLLAAGLLGGLPPILRRWSEPVLHRLVALSAGVFLGSVAHLMLDLFSGHGHGAAAADPHAGHDHAGHDHIAGLAEGVDASVFADPGLWLGLLVGFLGWWLLDRLLLSKQVHDHAAHGIDGQASSQHAGHASQHAMVWRASFLGLGLHAAMAGLGAAGLFAGATATLGLVGIIGALAVHKAVETFSLGTLMRLAELRPARAALWMLAFSCITPGVLLAGGSAVERFAPLAMFAAAFSAGTFLSVTIFHLLPEAFHVKSARRAQGLLVAVGAVVAVVVPEIGLHDAGFASRVVDASLAVFVEMAPFLLLGFLAAGLISLGLSPAKLRGWFGKEDAKSVTLASIAGAPLPLCSCSVVPVAATLRNAGASRGATSAFLVATPETGVDSIAVTYGLFGPVMAIARPLAAVSTAIATGLAVSNFAGDEPAPEPAATDGCCKKVAAQAEAQRKAELDGAAQRPSGLVSALRYGFGDLVDDLAWPLVLGVVLSGLIAALLPIDLFGAGGIRAPWQHFLMLAIGLPVYVCASASTPIAAILVAKGLAPGAALVFLLASPATNLGSLVVVRKLLGDRGLVVHLIVLSILTLACGFALDAVLSATGLTIAGSELAAGEHLLPQNLHLVAAWALAAVLGASFLRSLLAGGEAHDHGGSILPASVLGP